MNKDDLTGNRGNVLDIELRQPNEAEQAAMLAMARQAIDDHLANGREPSFEPHQPILTFRAGAFVTLRESGRRRQSGPGRLRGCIGHMQPDRPLYHYLY